MQTALLSNYGDIVTEIKDSLKQVKIESSIQMHASKKEFKEVLSQSSERSRKNQTIFCVIKIRRKPEVDDRSDQSSPYIMFHSTKLFKVFLAQTGAQGVTLSVRLSVCAAQTCLEHSIFILLGQRALREQSSSQRAIEQSESS